MTLPERTLGTPQEAARQPGPRGTPQGEDLTDRQPLDHLLDAVFDRVSAKLAGGQRKHPNDLLPESDEPMEGIIPDDYRPDLTMADWFDPLMFIQGDPDLSQVSSGGPGKEGDGMDWFRSGEAPNNYANRHNPLYESRRQFAIGVAPKIEELFGVSAQGSAGYMRQPHPSHKAPGGPSANSDHYSGGAIDFFGSPENLTALRNWLIEQPFTSFVRWQSESHYDHLHVSFDLGWVAENYGQVDTLNKIPDYLWEPQTQQTPTETRGGGGGARPV